MKIYKKESNFNPEKSSIKALEGIRILIIEDEESIRNVMTIMLEKEGCLIKTAQNGKEAMRMFSTASYDIIITDMAMPEKNGVDTIIELRQLTPPVGIIAMSGVVSSDKLLRLATAFDADLTLKKPFTREEIISAIKTVLKKVKGD